jgi:hypothetical protein
VQSQEYDSGGQHLPAKDKFAKIFVIGDQNPLFGSRFVEPHFVITASSQFGWVNNVMSKCSQLLDNLCGDVFIREELHAERLRSDSRVQVDQSGGVQKSGPQVLCGQARMRFEQVSLAGPSAEFAQHMFYSDSRTLEYGFAHHHAWQFLDVVLPIHMVIVSRTISS